MSKNTAWSDLPSMCSTVFNGMSHEGAVRDEVSYRIIAPVAQKDTEGLCKRCNCKEIDKQL
jgi:hypothetical protein